MAGFDSPLKKPSLTKLSRRFFIAGSSDGPLLKQAMKASLKFEGVWMSSIFKTAKSSKS
jgi:hypothetical protein